MSIYLPDFIFQNILEYANYNVRPKSKTPLKRKHRTEIRKYVKGKKLFPEIELGNIYTANYTLTNHGYIYRVIKNTIISSGKWCPSHMNVEEYYFKNTLSGSLKRKLKQKKNIINGTVLYTANFGIKRIHDNHYRFLNNKFIPFISSSLSKEINNKVKKYKKRINGTLVYTGNFSVKPKKNHYRVMNNVLIPSITSKLCKEIRKKFG